MENRLFFLINQAQSSLYKSVDQGCIDATGIPVTQGAALLAIEKNNGCSISWLRNTLKVNKSSIGALTERMERNGIIERKVDSEDARITRVHLTERGREKLDDLKPLIASHNRLLKAEFSVNEIETVVKFLNHVIKISER